MHDLHTLFAYISWLLQVTAFIKQGTAEVSSIYKSYFLLIFLLSGKLGDIVVLCLETVPYIFSQWLFYLYSKELGNSWFYTVFFILHFTSSRFSIFVFLIITTLSLIVILCSFDDFSDHYIFKNYFILIWLCIQHKALRNFADCLLGYFKN